MVALIEEQRAEYGVEPICAVLRTAPATGPSGPLGVEQRAGSGAVGHINASSGLGSWPDGRALLGRLLEGSERRVGVPSAGPRGRAAGSGRE
jgi:hypothetical protein